MSVIKKALNKIVNAMPSSAVIMFHHVSSSPKNQKSNCLLDYEAFKSIIKKYDGNFSDLETVMKRPRKKKIAITFDDGLEDVYTLAYPVLAEKKIPFTVFVVTDFIGTDGYINEEQLKEMLASGLLTIGSHGTTHGILKGMSEEKQKEEFERSSEILSKIASKPINGFAYSHGQYDSVTLKCAKRYKYCFCAGGGHGVNFVTKTRRSLIPRINVENATFEKALKDIDRIIKYKR